MKQLITASALVALLASPAFAQTHQTHVGAQARAAQANAAPADTDNGPRGQIVWGSKVRGQDPDAFIRSQIARGLGNYGAD